MNNHFLLTPYFIDSPTPGLRRAARPGWDFHDPSLPEGTQQQRLAALYPGLADWVHRTAAAGERPVSIAGDCCTSIAVLAGLQRAGLDPTLSWFDAHGDFNTWETTPSGFLGGMPLAWLTGRGEQTICRAVGLKNLPDERVILTDARDLDPGERELVAGSGITQRPSVEELLEFPLPAGPLWVHFDTDVLRPEDAAAMNYLAPGGPAAETLGQVFDHLAASGQLQAVSVSSWNPELDPERRTEAVCMALIDRLAGDD